jgi:hypothetical protein
LRLAEPPRLSSFVKVLTHSSTGSCGDGSTEYGRRCATVEAIATMCPLMVVELQKPVKRSLQRAPAREVLPPKGDAPVLVQDRFLQAFDEAIGPGVAGLRPRDPDAEELAAGGERPPEFFAVVREHALQPPPAFR